MESLEIRKRKVVHANNLRRFVVDAAADPLNEDSEDMLSSHSDESTIESVNERAGVRLRPQRTRGQEEPLNLRYNLRQNRRQPERYGAPVMDY